MPGFERLHCPPQHRNLGPQIVKRARPDLSQTSDILPQFKTTPPASNDTPGSESGLHAQKSHWDRQDHSKTIRLGQSLAAGLPKAAILFPHAGLDRWTRTSPAGPLQRRTPPSVIQ
jgi:hypothetical protein